jgi:hypothetical protein
MVVAPERPRFGIPVTMGRPHKKSRFVSAEEWLRLDTCRSTATRQSAGFGPLP